MLWFTPNTKSRMKRRYSARVRCAQLLRRDIRLQRLLSENAALVSRCLETTQADEREFVALFGEPMPDHLRIAAHLEADVWMSLRNLLDAAKKQNGDVYDQTAERVRERTETLCKLLALEQEILYSPLRLHFIDRLAALRKVPG